MPEYKNPKPTVDIIIVMDQESDDPSENKIVLVKRKNPPEGWALPGGFVNEGESLETAALREGKEETDLELQLAEQFHTYSAPDRDPRQHTLSTVYIALPTEETPVPIALDDAAELKVVTIAEALGMDLAFDHERIIGDFLDYLETDMRPCVCGGDEDH